MQLILILVLHQLVFKAIKSNGFIHLVDRMEKWCYPLIWKYIITLLWIQQEELIKGSIVLKEIMFNFNFVHQQVVKHIFLLQEMLHWPCFMLRIIQLMWMILWLLSWIWSAIGTPRIQFKAFHLFGNVTMALLIVTEIFFSQVADSRQYPVDHIGYYLSYIIDYLILS